MMRFLALVLALPLFMRPAPAQVGGGDCTETCTAVLSVALYNLDFIITASGVANGTAVPPYCDPCTPCHAVMNWTYVGTQRWSVYWTPNGRASAYGYGSGSADLYSKCDAPDPGHSEGWTGSVPVLAFEATLYCTC